MLHYSETVCVVQGLTVASLSKTSGAYHDGLRNGDVVVKVNNVHVRNRDPSTVQSMLRSYNYVLSPVTFDVERLSSVEQSPEASDYDIAAVSNLCC